MLTFDKIKIVASLGSVEVIDQTIFTIVKKHGVVKSMRMCLTEPCNINMELNYESREFILEFTGKILGRDYPQLISLQTIAACFEKINEMGFCILNTEEMMMAEVVKCDITKDIPVEDIPEMSKWIRANVSNYQSYSCRMLANKNLIIEKNVCTKINKKRMTIYNKENEMALRRERDFISENDLNGAFNGLCRFELNLCSKKQIRDALGLTGNTLWEVLSSNKNPIADFMDEVIFERSTEPNDGHDCWKNYWRSLILQDCNYDLAKVEAKLRQYKNPRSANIPKMMIPFREILTSCTSGETAWTKEKLLSALR